MRALVGTNIIELNPATVMALIAEGLNRRLLSEEQIVVESYSAPGLFVPILRFQVKAAVPK